MASHGQSNKVMNRGKIQKDDEFYTTEKTVKKIMSLIDLSELQDKIVWCPFGTDSEFVKFFRRLERERD